MGSFARARARKEKKAARVGNERGVKQAAKVQRSVKGAYVYQLRYDTAVRKEALSNLSAVFMYAMHEKYGFGAGYLERLRNKMQSVFDSIVAGNVSVEEIAKFLHDEIKLDCGVDTHDPKADHHRQIEFKAVKEMSAAFLMALLDEFGFKKKRLGDAYIHCAELSDRLSRNEITYPKIRAEIEEVFKRKKIASPLGNFKAITRTRKVG